VLLDDEDVYLEKHRLVVDDEEKVSMKQWVVSTKQ
jgi:hypothetical protein